MTSADLARELRATADQVLAWAAGSENSGPFGEEIYRTNVQVAVALTMLADRIEQSQPGSGS